MLAPSEHSDLEEEGSVSGSSSKKGKTSPSLSSEDSNADEINKASGELEERAGPSVQVND